LGCGLCLVAIAATLGGHWLALQSIAWTCMIIDSSRQAPIREAIAMVFDGKHPCSLCLSIREGRQQEQAENKNLPSVRPENAPEYL